MIMAALPGMVARLSRWLLLFYAIAASVVTAWLWMTGLQQEPAAQAGAFSLALAGVVLPTWPDQKRSANSR